MEHRQETIHLRGLQRKMHLLHISDVHFSAGTSHEKNMQVTAEILRLCEAADAVCLTGDLISRRLNADSLPDALDLLTRLREFAPVLYSLGNHETDLAEEMRRSFLKMVQQQDITVLDNAVTCVQGVFFAGVTLPKAVYKSEKGRYFDLLPITRKLLTDCLGSVPGKPCILLAHSPMGFPAYARWGADLTLSGHVHGGIIRVKNVGLLSPERKFLPLYTKGIYHYGHCLMHVSAGIGKFRVNNPAEVVSLDLLPEE